MQDLFRRCLLTCALALALAAAPPSGLAASKTASGPSLAAQLRTGRLVVRDGVTIEGRLDLTGVEVVRRAFKCRGCTFRGPVLAPDVTFERMVDVSGSTFEGIVDFRSATFRGPALFRNELAENGEADGGRPLIFQARADFSLAFFDELVSFAGAEFKSTAVFRDARFSDAGFGSTTFRDAAAFERASFRGAAVFNNAVFDGAGAFREADFRRRADFSLAQFYGAGDFTRARFTEDGSFLAARFYSSPRSEEAAKFQSVTAAGDLDFTFGGFSLGEQPAGTGDSAIAVFSDFVSAGSLVFRDATFDEQRRIGMHRLQVRDLVLDVDVVPRIAGKEDQRDILEAIEESAKTRGDLADANDAHYALRVMRSKDYGPFVRFLDYVFYRGAAGYLVRPAQPLLLLLILATTMALVRVAGIRYQSSPVGSRWRPSRLLRDAWRRCGDFFTCLLDSFSLIAPGGGEKGAMPLGRRLESFAYRLLVVCGLLGLANSNPTLRDMVDTLF